VKTHEMFRTFIKKEVGQGIWMPSETYTSYTSFGGADGQADLVLLESPVSAAITPTNSAPTIGKFSVEKMEGTLDMLGYDITSSNLVVGFGLRVAEWDADAGAYTSLNPLVAADASSANWVWITSRMVQMCTFNAALSPFLIASVSPLHLDLSMPVRSCIGPGQALILSLATEGLGTSGQAYFYSAPRLLVRHIE